MYLSHFGRILGATGDSLRGGWYCDAMLDRDAFFSVSRCSRHENARRSDRLRPNVLAVCRDSSPLLPREEALTKRDPLLAEFVISI